MLSTPQIMDIDTRMQQIIERLQNALESADRAMDVANPTNLAGEALLDPLTGDPEPSYAYATGLLTAAVRGAVSDLTVTQQMLTT